MEEELESPFKPHHEEASEEKAERGPRWIGWCAVVSALLAVAAATMGLYSGHFANEAVLERIQASDQWNYYQAKGVKAAIQELGGNADKVSHYREEQETIKASAEQLEKHSERHLAMHEQLASSVTLLQIAIALTAITVLTRRKHFMGMVALLAAAGGYFALRGFLL